MFTFALNTSKCVSTGHLPVHLYTELTRVLLCKTVDSISVDCVLNGGLLCFVHTMTLDIGHRSP